MKTIHALMCLGTLLFISLTSKAQQTKRWTETDRQWLLDSLKITRDQLIKETEELSAAEVCDATGDAIKRCSWVQKIFPVLNYYFFL